MSCLSTFELYFDLQMFNLHSHTQQYLICTTHTFCSDWNLRSNWRHILLCQPFRAYFGLRISIFCFPTIHHRM